MDNKIYKVDKDDNQLSDIVSGSFTAPGWIRIDDWETIGIGREDYIHYGDAELPDSDGLYQIVEAECGIFRVEKREKSK